MRLMATAAALLVLEAVSPLPSNALGAQLQEAVGEGAAAAETWRQGIEYRIEARLDEESEVLRGRARVRYRNDSPHTIRDFYFHLYLNAFRPNSAWARSDLRHGITTFQELGPDEHGFERIRTITADDDAVLLRYPFAPDSTIVGFELPSALEPGETVTIDYTWDARPSSVPRRQGRQGRQWDFAQWYPRVVVYDDEGWRIHPLYRQGEFYGEFATYDVSLQVAEDQVIGATGVPVAGDPGWEDAAVSGTGPVLYQREWYGSLEGPPCLERGGERICGVFPAKRMPSEEALGLIPETAPAGEKQVRWYAENVHHFAWSTSPEYIYEQGVWDDVAIHVLYRPGDEESWGGGVAVRRTATALEWFDSIFGDYAYPHVTNLHRIEGGGTEFPMVIMDGSASQGLILHEVGHIYAHGILANNEWYEGWLDEGMSSFLTTWFSEAAGAGPEVWRGSQLGILQRELRGETAPIVMPAEEYGDYGLYTSMIYTKASLVLWMFREMVGEEDFVRVLRMYYDRYRLRHVDTDALKRVAEEVLRQDFDWFFGQWLHSTGLVDYALDDVHVRPGEAAWVTSFVVERVGDMVMPVPVRLSGQGMTRDFTVDGWAEVDRVAFRTAFRPDRVELDPDGTVLDWNVRNNAWERGGLLPPLRDLSLDNPLAPVPTEWREIPIELFPLAWWNDAGGYVAGLQARSARLGLVDRSLVRLGLPALDVGERDGPQAGFDPGSLYLRLEDPVARGAPRFGTRLEAFAGEGRYLAASTVEHGRGNAPGDRPRSVRATGRLYGVYDDAYAVPGRWTPGRHLGAEGAIGGALLAGTDALPLSLDLEVGAGFDSGDARWLRASAALALDLGGAGGWRARTRLFGGAAYGWSGASDRFVETVHGGDVVPRERMFFLAGGDPLASLSNPWVRSRGALLADGGRTPGGGQLPGFHAGFALPQLATAGLELGPPPLEFEVGGHGWVLRPLLFGGVGVGGDLDPARDPLVGALGGSEDEIEAVREAGHLFYSAGAGVEFGIGTSPIRIRLDAPVLVADAVVASRERSDTFGLRWSAMVTGY